MAEEVRHQSVDFSGGPRTRREHRRRRAPHARALRRRLALRGGHLGPAGPPADRLAVRHRRDRRAAVRADPARARRAQPLARALLPALERDADRAHGRGRRRPTAARRARSRCCSSCPWSSRRSRIRSPRWSRSARSTTSPTSRWASRAQQPDPEYVGFFALCLGCIAALCGWHARNQDRRRDGAARASRARIR